MSTNKILPIRLERVTCRSCKEPRWDDGLRCVHCGDYQNQFLEYDPHQRTMVDIRLRKPVPEVLR